MNKLVLITGATRNVGYAMAEKFASQNYDVIITSRSAEDAQAAAAALQEKYPQVKIHPMEMQLSSVEHICECFRHIAREHGHLDALVVNAAHLAINTNIMNVTPEDYDRIMTPNLKGNFFLCQKATELMGEGGAVLFISSVHANQCIPNRILYSMTKAAINALCRSMAVELGHKGIRANAIDAGAIWTERWIGLSDEEIARRRKPYPAGRESTPEEIAEGAYFLCSDAARTITGTELVIDSGVSTTLLTYDANWHKNAGGPAGQEPPRAPRRTGK